MGWGLLGVVSEGDGIGTRGDEKWWGRRTADEQAPTSCREVEVHVFETRAAVWKGVREVLDLDCGLEFLLLRLSVRSVGIAGLDHCRLDESMNRWRKSHGEDLLR